MEEKLTRLEEQMKRLLIDFRDTCDKNEELRLENERLISDLLEKNRQLEVLEEGASVLMETQAEKKSLEEQRQRIREEVEKLLNKVRSLKDGNKT